jgi:hypothetical protein
MTVLKTMDTKPLLDADKLLLTTAETVSCQLKQSSI